eukprot:SAG31_NODE_4480_length_3200_cov_1.900355_3_plen_136_part_00
MAATRIRLLDGSTGEILQDGRSLAEYGIERDTVLDGQWSFADQVSDVHISLALTRLILTHLVNFILDSQSTASRGSAWRDQVSRAVKERVRTMEMEHKSAGNPPALTEGARARSKPRCLLHMRDQTYRDGCHRFR